MKRASGLKLRRARPEDLDAVCSLPANRREAFWTFPAHSYPVRPGELSQNLQSRFDPTVAELNGRLAGFANLYRVIEGESCYVGNLVVGPQHRRRGVAGRLLKAMAARAREAYQARSLCVSCFNDNLGGLFFYHGLEFVPFALEPLVDWDREPVALIHFRRAVEGLAANG